MLETSLASCRTFLCVICLVALGLRAYQIRESLWIDELHTSWCVAGDLNDVGSRARMGNNSPLYFHLLRGITVVLGHDELSLRILSVVSGIAIIAVMYVLVLRWTESHGLAALSALLATTDPNFLFYSLEARPYVLVQLLALIQAGVYVSLLRCPSIKRRLAFVVTGILMFYCHYTSVLMLPVFIIHFGATRMLGRGTKDYSWRSFAFDCMCMALLCSFTLPHLMEIAGRRSNWELFVRRLPMSHLLRMFPLWPTVGTAAVVAGISLCVRARWNKREDQQPVDWELIAFLVIWLFVPLMAAWISTETNLARLYFRRYVICAAAAPMLLTSALLTAAPSRISRMLAATSILALSLAIGPTARLLLTEGKVVNHSREDWRQAIAELNQQWHAQPGPLFFRSGLIEADALRLGQSNAALREYCLFPLNAAYHVESAIGPRIPLATTDTGDLTTAQLELIKRSDSIWFLLRGSRSKIDKILRAVRETANDNGITIEFSFREDFGNLALIQIDTTASGRHLYSSSF